MLLNCTKYKPSIIIEDLSKVTNYLSFSFLINKLMNKKYKYFCFYYSWYQNIIDIFRCDTAPKLIVFLKKFDTPIPNVRWPKPADLNQQKCCVHEAILKK